jgi:ankyrin repeat protein
MHSSVSELSAAVTSGDADAVRALLARRADVKAALDEPMAGGSFDQQALLIAAARGNRAVVDALLDSGAHINVRSRWCHAGGGV